MRNLKKILALVLALVMSLSLMATAGASKFPDVDAENPYATAIDVLDGLKVFQGFEDGTFKPTDTLNRAQAAVLVYRIATGDVENKYLDNYTFMQQSKFTDLEGYNWAKGYINYCQNAGIVVGTTATTFDPGAKVTGYQLLVMLLRTLGYGKAGEFADPKGWELQTATIAEREGITKNVTAGDFGAPAPRQMVAEILFRGLLSESVEYSALIPGGYTKTGETLGMREFGLEKISGVVMANEWANLNDGAAGAKVLAAGTTQMVLEDGTTRTLSVATDLDAVGLTYNAYIANGEGGAKKSLTMEKSDINVVAFNEGQAVGPKGKTLYDENRRQGSIPDLADEEGLEITSSTGYYIDYDQGWYKDCTSDYQISYVVNVNMASTTTNSPGISLDEAETKEIITEDEHDDLIALIETAYGKKEADFPANFVFSRSIRIGDAISETDLAIMESIFDLAGRYEANNPVVKGYTIGEVYVGTTQTKDYSDEMSWKAFKAEYLNNSKETVKFDYAQAGESLRVVDNNGDGDAEYVLKVTYTMDQVIGTYKDAPELNEWRVASKYKDNNLYQPDELAVGDVVVWNVIDGKLSLWKAESVTETIKTKTFKDITVTTTEDNTYGQSGITNNTGMDDLIMNMDEKVEYIMFKDRFGFIRAYTLAQGSQYALLTEMYPSGSQNWNYVRNTEWTAEMTMGDAETAEYKVVNMTGGKYDGSVFASNSVWTKSLRNHYQNEWNYLQPAVAHLGNPNGLDRNYNPGRTYTDDEFYNYGYYNNTTWNRMVMEMATVADTNPYGVFAYDTAFTFTDKDTGAVIKNEPAFSFTNVAAYVMDGEDVTLASAAKLAKNTNGEVYYYNVNALDKDDTNDDTARPAYGNRYVASEWAEKGIKDYATLKAAYDAGVLTPVYATDYVQLAKQDVKANTKHFDIHANYGSYYTANSNGYVNATVDTEFYIVTPDRITYKVGYGDLPTIKAGQIRAAYAVANNTRAAANGLDYWVADVIVIEVNKTESDWDSVSAVYYNPFETTGAIRYLNSLNSAWKTWQPDSEDKAILDVVPTVVTGGIVGNPNGSQSWGDNSWTVDEYGFYALYTTELDESGDLTAKEAKKITDDWNKYGIYAGTIQRIYQLTGSNYIDVDKEGRAYYGIPLTGAQVEALNVQDIPVYRVTKTSASEITLSAVKYSDVKVGDPIIWVYEKGSTSKIAYIIDLATVAKSYDTTVGNYPTWLRTYDKDGIATGGDYYDIVEYQKSLGKDYLNVTVRTGAGEDAFISNVKTNVAGNVEMATDDGVTTITIPDGATVVEFTVNCTGTLTADKLILAIDNKWELYSRDDGADPATSKTSVVKLIRKTSLDVKASAITGDPVKTLVGDNTILTVDYLTNVIVARIADLTTQYAIASDADKAVIAKELNAIKESLELLQEPYAVVDAAAQTTVTDQIDAIEDVVGDGSEPDEDKAAAAKALVEAYEDYLLKNNAGLTPGTVQAALDAALTAAVAYEDYYTVDGTADADVAYAELVDALDTKVKAVVDAAADLTDLANIKAAAAAVEAAKAYANGLSIASWGAGDLSSVANVAAYNEKVTTINAKATLLTKAENLVRTYKAYSDAAEKTDALWTAYDNAWKAVDALTGDDKTLITSCEATDLFADITVKPKDAYDNHANLLAARPAAADVTLEPADTLVTAKDYKWDAATKTLTVNSDETVDAAAVKGYFKAADSSVFGASTAADAAQGDWTDVDEPVAGTAENTWKFTFNGVKGGTAQEVTVTVLKATVAEAAEYDLADAVAKVEGKITAADAGGGSEAAVKAAILAAVKEKLGVTNGNINDGAWGSAIAIVDSKVTLNVTGDWDPIPEDGSRDVSAAVTIQAGTGTNAKTQEITLSVRVANPKAAAPGG